MAHSALITGGRTSSTVTDRASSSQVLKVSTAMVIMGVLLFRSRPAAPALASLEGPVRVDAPGTRWSAAKQPPHRQTHNTDRDNRPLSPSREETLGDVPPGRAPEWIG